MDYIVHGVAETQTRLSDFHIKYKETFPFILLAHKLILKQKGP